MSFKILIMLTFHIYIHHRTTNIIKNLLNLYMKSSFFSTL